MQLRLQKCDCVIEVHDARISFTPDIAISRKTCISNTYTAKLLYTDTEGTGLSVCIMEVSLYYRGRVYIKFCLFRSK